MVENSTSVASAIREFMKLESAGGVLLLIAAVAAMLVANSPLLPVYDAFLDAPVGIQVADWTINKPLLLWINDGLMAIFFFLIGLELKREVLEGELSSASQIALPAVGALGGMFVPMAIFAWFNWNDPVALDGWAIPAATDIAFALALLSVFGSRVPTALKIFLLTLAIFDDLGAIVIIALFYSEDISLTLVIVGIVAFVIALLMNRAGVSRTSTYILLGIVLWVALLKSGVHATLAGVLIALCIPMRDKDGNSPLRSLEHDLHGAVVFAILPIFAFANGGLPFDGLTIDSVMHPVTLGIILGLFVGKPLGIMAFVGLAAMLRLVKLPDDVTWAQILGVAFASGIGFTMSLFIAGLAFEHGDGSYFDGDRLGVLIGSVLSAIAALLVLQLALRPSSAPQPE
jgi:NhaA family Na+:H+ antiporter